MNYIVMQIIDDKLKYVLIKKQYWMRILITVKYLNLYFMIIMKQLILMI